MVKKAVTGYPRIGEKRELKKVSEEYFKGLVSKEELQAKAKEIREKIMFELGMAVTNFKSTVNNFDSIKKGSNSGGNDGNVLFCVVTRLEVTKLLYEIEDVDPNAFVVQYSIKDTKGGMIKKRPLH